MSLKSFWRGFVGEKTATLGMWLFLDRNTYHRFHNVIVPADKGTTQIDHVLVSEYGIFVIETKNMGGWIFGCEDDAQWTQVLFGKKFRFQNPLRQNYRHTKALAGFLRLEHSLFHSIAFCMGDCRFKTQLPDKVMTRGLASYIKRFTSPVVDKARVAEITARITGLQMQPVASNAGHVAALNNRYSSSTTCARCGRSLIKKTAKRGPSAGQDFLGCTGYPKCRYTRSIA